MKQTTLTTPEHRSRVLPAILITVSNVLVSTFQFFWNLITKVAGAIAAGFLSFADAMARFGRPPLS